MKFAMTIKEFCSAHSIGPTLFHEMQRRGDGPTVMKVGRKRLVSVEAAEAWRRQLEVANSGSRPR